MDAQEILLRAVTIVLSSLGIVVVRGITLSIVVPSTFIVFCTQWTLESASNIYSNTSITILREGFRITNGITTPTGNWSSTTAYSSSLSAFRFRTSLVIVLTFGYLKEHSA